MGHTAQHPDHFLFSDIYFNTLLGAHPVQIHTVKIMARLNFVLFQNRFIWFFSDHFPGTICRLAFPMRGCWRHFNTWYSPYWLFTQLQFLQWRRRHGHISNGFSFFIRLGLPLLLRSSNILRKFHTCRRKTEAPKGCLFLSSSSFILTLPLQPPRCWRFFAMGFRYGRYTYFHLLSSD